MGVSTIRPPDLEPRVAPAPEVRRPPRRIRRDWVLVALGAPGLALILFFHYVPILGSVIAFKDYQPFLTITESPWVGLDNFRVLVTGDPAFLTALKNTLVILFLQVVLVFPLPIALAVLVDSLLSDKARQLVQSVLYLPHFLSWVIVVAIFQQFLGDVGVVNNLLKTAGGDPVDIIGNPDVFKALITSQVIWKDTGWAMIIFLAALGSIPNELYEAAYVDGAGVWRRVWHVTLPGLKGLIIMLLILRLGDALNVGFEQLVLQRDLVGPVAAEVLDTYVYFNGIVGGQWGVAAAVGLVKGLVGVALVLGSNSLAHRFGERGVYSTK